MVYSLLFVLLLQPQTGSLPRLYEENLARVEAANGPDARETGQAALDFGILLLRVGQAEAATATLARAVKILGSDEARELHGRALLSAGQPEQARAVFTQLSGSSDHKFAAAAFTLLAEASEDRGAACALYRKANSLEETSARLNALGLCERDLGQLPASLSHFRRALVLDEKATGPQSAVTLNNLARTLMQSGSEVEAQALQYRSWRILDKTLGPRHTRTAVSASTLGDILQSRGKLLEARQFYSIALAIFQLRLGRDHPWTQAAQAALASTLRP